MASNGPAGHARLIQRIDMAAHDGGRGARGCQRIGGAERARKPFKIKTIGFERSPRETFLDAAELKKRFDMRRYRCRCPHSANDTIFANLFGRKVLSLARIPVLADRRDGGARVIEE